MKFFAIARVLSWGVACVFTFVVGFRFVEASTEPGPMPCFDGCEVHHLWGPGGTPLVGGLWYSNKTALFPSQDTGVPHPSGTKTRSGTTTEWEAAATLTCPDWPIPTVLEVEYPYGGEKFNEIHDVNRYICTGAGW